VTVPLPVPVSLQNRPLIVSDIDEVVLEFLTPFDRYLRSKGHELLPRSFRLHGNIVSLDTGIEASRDAVDAFEHGFYADQENWQFAAPHAIQALHSLSRHADIVFLTAMPPRHEATRRALLDRISLPFPMIATEEPKGKIVKALHGDRRQPVFFIDDIARNLQSVRAHLPSCFLIHLMANDAFRRFAPETEEDVLHANDWLHAQDLILAQLIELDRTAQV
jgi:hypothetical protein